VQGKCCSRNHDLAISDNPIRRGDVEEDTRTCIRDRLFGTFIVVEIAARGLRNSDRGKVLWPCGPAGHMREELAVGG
jgi:hypothetical protein